MNSKLSGIWLATALFLSPMAFGGTYIDSKNGCEFKGRIELKAPTDISCNGDDNLTFAPGTVIITNGHDLSIEAMNKIHFNDLQIHSFDEQHSAKSEDAGLIEIGALDADGKLNIINLGLGEEGRSGNVFLKIKESDKYKKSVVYDGTQAKLIESQG